MGNVKTNPDYPRGLDFEQVWAALQATGERIDRMVEEANRRSAELDRRSAEAERRSAELDRRFEETKAVVAETSRQIENLGGSFKETKAIVEETSRQIGSLGGGFEETKAIVAETSRQIGSLGGGFEETKAIVAETSRQIGSLGGGFEETKAIVAETSRQIENLGGGFEKTKAIVEETSRQIGSLGSRFGEMIEYMVKPNLVVRFRELGFVFTKVHQNTSIKDEKNGIITEVDFTLEDGDKVMIVETKSKPSIGDIKKHVERMEKLRRHADLHNDQRKYLGAIAGMVVNDNERDYALKNGFYVIVPSGDTFDIIEPKGDYQPREW